MNNKIYILIAIVIIAMVGFVFLSNDDMVFKSNNVDTSNKIHKNIKSTDVNDKIEYSKNKPRHLQKVHKIKREKKVELPTNIKYKTSDSSGLYSIELIDESKTSVGNGLSIPLKGVIDGKHFLVEVPEALKNYDLKLKVTNRKTKEVKEVALPFTSEMSVNKNNPYMQIEFKDIENYSMNFTSKKNIFP